MTLRAEGIHWEFQDGEEVRQIFRGLSLGFEAGRSYAVTGPSGCGKTTLLSLLSLICRPTRGAISYRGADVSSLGPREAQRFRREHVGLVFQTFRLLEHLTVEEQIVFATGVKRRKECLAKGLELLVDFGMRPALGRLPRELSGGEKQRVALAQALMFAPGIVLADEPTAALDEQNSSIVSDLLTGYARDQQAVLVAVSHDRSLIEKCSDRIDLGAGTPA